MGPFSICRVVAPDGCGVVSVPLWAEGIVVWSVGCPNGWVCPEDPVVVPPGVAVVPGIAVPLFSIMFSRMEWCFCCPQVALGLTHLPSFWSFDKDLDEEVCVWFDFVEDVEFAIPAGQLGGNEPRMFFRGKDQQGGFFDDMSGVASIDRRLKWTLWAWWGGAGLLWWQSGAEPLWGDCLRSRWGLVPWHNIVLSCVVVKKKEEEE